MTLEDLKNQLRIDGVSDDTFLTELLSEAQEYIMNAVDSKIPLADYEQYPIFDRAVALLVGHWYFNRTDQSETEHFDNPFGVEAIVNQLRGLMWVDDSGESDVTN